MQKADRDIYIQAPTREALLADLAALGYAADGEIVMPEGCAYDLATRVELAPAGRDAEGEVTTPATLLDGVVAVLRVTPEIAASLRGAAMTASQIVEYRAGFPVLWGGPLGEDIETAKVAKCAAVNAARDALLFGIFTDSHGIRYDVDERSRLNMTGLEAKLASGYIPDAGFSWRDADNVDRAHDAESFRVLTAEITAWTNAVHVAGRIKKAAVDALGSAAAVQAYDVEAGWPQ